MAVSTGLEPVISRLTTGRPLQLDRETDVLSFRLDAGAARLQTTSELDAVERRVKRKTPTSALEGGRSCERASYLVTSRANLLQQRIQRRA